MVTLAVHDGFLCFHMWLFTFFVTPHFKVFRVCQVAFCHLEVRIMSCGLEIKRLRINKSKHISYFYKSRDELVYNTVQYNKIQYNTNLYTGYPHLTKVGVTIYKLITLIKRKKFRMFFDQTSESLLLTDHLIKSLPPINPDIVPSSTERNPAPNSLTFIFSL